VLAFPNESAVRRTVDISKETSGKRAVLFEAYLECPDHPLAVVVGRLHPVSHILSSEERVDIEW
jgi:hypothetical protein